MIGWSSSRDVAIIEVEEALPLSLEWADPDDLREGDHLLTLGYPVPGMDFSAIPGTVLSFDRVGDVRRAIRTDGQADHGDSGGPALTRSGQVAGVVTEFDPNEDGVQLVALANTHDCLGGWIDDTLADPDPPRVSCAHVENYFGYSPYGEESYSPEEEFFPELPVVPDGPSTYGDDPVLDKLYDYCAAGDDDTCDLLWLRSTPGSAYEAFADICGGRRPPGYGGACGGEG